MNYKSKKSQKGFTLVELAIVLVIIGLIVSGVLVGQDLIKTAELRATTRQYNEFQVAINTFIGKYNGIPGDIQGSKYGLEGLAAYQDGSAGDGDGDGTIEETNASTVLTFTGEMSTFWSHLSTPGKELIKGVFNGDGCATSNGNTNCYAQQDWPRLKFGSTGWAVYGVSGTNYFTTGAIETDSNVTNMAVDFVPVDMFNIDSKIDDGVPNAGDVQALGAHATVISTAATSTAGESGATCINTSPSIDEYQFTATEAKCRMQIKMQTF